MLGLVVAVLVSGVPGDAPVEQQEVRPVSIQTDPMRSAHLVEPAELQSAPALPVSPGWVIGGTLGALIWGGIAAWGLGYEALGIGQTSNNPAAPQVAFAISGAVVGALGGALLGVAASRSSPVAKVLIVLLDVAAGALTVLTVAAAVALNGARFGGS
jgi:hypothetical protein